MRAFSAVAVAAALLAFVLALLASAASLVDLLVFLAALAVFVSPGWPLCRWIAGQAADNWSRTILALLFGYLTSCLLMVCLRGIGVSSPVACLFACGVLAAVLHVALPRRPDGVMPPVRLGPADVAALAILWLITAAIVGPVFARVGQPTSDGLAFRAYFIADLFAHMSVVGELAKGATPPVNPYLPVEALPYYWTYFQLPALVTMLRPAPLLHHAILLADVVAAFLFAGVGYLVVRNLGASPLATGASWTVVILANSYEGAYFLWRNWQIGPSAESFRVVNIDAITRWFWGLPGVDGFQRLMWWTPQHEMALTMGLLVLALSVRARDRNGLGRATVDGLLLGGAIAFSSFNGVLLVLWYAVMETAMLVLDRGRDYRRWLLARSATATIVLAALALTVALQMLQSTSGASIWGWNQHFLRGPWRFVLLNFGPALFLAPLGVGLAFRKASRLVIGLTTLSLVAVTAFLAFDVRGHENTYVVFRAAQLFFLVLAVLLALAIDAARAWPRPARAAFVGVLILGSLAAVPTVAIDWYNARDTANVEMNPGGFPWTVHFTPSEQVAARWIQQNLPVVVKVQTDPRARGRATWAFVPAFCRRRMATGLGLFEPDPTRFEANMDAIHAMFSTPDAAGAHAACTRLGIDYVYVGPVERRANPDGIGKFSEHPDLFRLAFRVMDEDIFEVERGENRR